MNPRNSFKVPNVRSSDSLVVAGAWVVTHAVHTPSAKSEKEGILRWTFKSIPQSGAACESPSAFLAKGLAFADPNESFSY